MGKILENATSGATLGGILGGALGVLLSGATIALPGVNVVLAPIIVAKTVATVTVSCGAVGRLTGGTAGAISGAREEKKER